MIIMIFTLFGHNYDPQNNWVELAFNVMQSSNYLTLSLMLKIKLILTI